MKSEDLRQARAELDMTQSELARELGLHKLSIIRYENGHHEIPRTVELAVSCLLMLNRKYTANSMLTEVEVEYVRSLAEDYLET